MNVSYHRLDVHEQYCEELTAQGDSDASVEGLNRRLSEMEKRLNRRIREIEATIQDDSVDWSTPRRRNGRSGHHRR